MALRHLPGPILLQWYTGITYCLSQCTFGLKRTFWDRLIVFSISRILWTTIDISVWPQSSFHRPTARTTAQQSKGISQVWVFGRGWITWKNPNSFPRVLYGPVHVLGFRKLFSVGEMPVRASAEMWTWDDQICEGPHTTPGNMAPQARHCFAPYTLGDTCDVISSFWDNTQTGKTVLNLPN